MRSLSRRIVWDDRDGPALAQEEPVVGGIGGAQARRWQAGKKGQNEAKVAALSGCYLDGERPALAVDNGVDFGCAPAARAPDRLFLCPLFRTPPSDELLLWCCRSCERHWGLLLPRRETASARGRAPTIDESGCRSSLAGRSTRGNPASDNQSSERARSR